MTIRRPATAEPAVTRDAAEEALRLLRHWASTADPAEVAALAPELAAESALSHRYPDGFMADPAYCATLPDLQNGPGASIRGALRRIEQVGISNFRLPLRFPTRDEGELRLETSVTGAVSLEAERKGINMSRIMRSFYAQADQPFGLEAMAGVVGAYLRDLGQADARLMLRLSLPVLRPSLRSGLAGYQYYDLAFEVVARQGVLRRMLHLDYVYSSTCPCSLELAEHARRTRGQMATPHAQRSVARISVALRDGGADLPVEDLIDLCRAALPTETQVMVKREDEQAFAELNAANPVFVEDAARLFAEQLQSDARIGDFRVIASHQESLHSHDAVAVLCEGDTFDQASLDPWQFSSLVHRG